MNELIRICMVAVIAAPGYWLARRNDVKFIGYAISVIALNRGLRRLMDFYQGSYSPVTVLSILPALMGALALPGAFKALRRMPSTAKLGFVCLVSVIGYGVFVGIFMGNPVGALYGAAEMLSPIFICMCATAMPWNLSRLISFEKWLAWTGALFAAYGIYQFFVLPEWDRVWIVNAEMASLGEPSAMNFRMFSSFPSPGPFALFLFPVLLLLLAGQVKLGMRWGASVMAIVAALLFVQVRTSWILFCISFVLYGLFSHDRRVLQSLVFLAMSATLASLALPLIPGAEIVFDRISTFQSIENDTSFQARSSFIDEALAMIFDNPFGTGLGSAGTSVRLESTGNVDIAFDNGVLFYPATFGLVFGPLFLFGLGVLGLALFASPRSIPCPETSQFLSIARAIFVAQIAGLTSSNVLEGTSGVLMWVLVGIALSILWRRGEVVGTRPTLSRGNARRLAVI